jgi:hypothetical protein
MPLSTLSTLVAFLLWADGGTAPHEVTSSAATRDQEARAAVESARAVFAEVRAALEAKQLVSREVPDCTQQFSSFTLATDAKGAVRLLVREFGGEDSSHRAETYYDAAGRLRFVFVKVGAVPSAWVEARYWLNEAGALVRKARAFGGEGPNSYANEPAEYLVKDPMRFVLARTDCPAQ